MRDQQKTSAMALGEPLRGHVPLTSVMSAESSCRQMVSPKHTQVFTCERTSDAVAAQSSPKINSVLALVEGEPQDPYKTRSGSFGAGPRTTVGLVW